MEKSRRNFEIRFRNKHKWSLLVAKNEKQIKDIHAKVSIENRFEITSEFLNKTDLRNIAPYLSDDVIGAMYYPDEGKANPLLVTPAFALKSEELGVQIS